MTFLVKLNRLRLLDEQLAERRRDGRQPLAASMNNMPARFDGKPRHVERHDAILRRILAQRVR